MGPKGSGRLDERRIAMNKQRTRRQDIKQKAGRKTDTGLPQKFGRTVVTGEERHQLIMQAAYFRAERRGFAPGAELDDWLQAEAEIDGALESLTADD